MDPINSIFSAVDIPLIMSIVVLIEMLKAFVFKKAKDWVWFLFLLAGGLGAAAIKVPVVHENWKGWIAQSLIYIAAAFIVYRLYKVTTLLNNARKAKKG